MVKNKQGLFESLSLGDVIQYMNGNTIAPHLLIQEDGQKKFIPAKGYDLPKIPFDKIDPERIQSVFANAKIEIR